ncbi:MAG TPA: MGMT family protein, partial [bacterium]|nr:MGMT family protein [bacterium]
FRSSKEKKLSVLLKGTPFQLKVWEALLRIPPGCLAAYKDVAEQIGEPKATRAVGTAIGRNSIAYLIPCHRVIRDSGVIGNYKWGPARKKAILAWESLKARS